MKQARANEIDVGCHCGHSYLIGLPQVADKVFHVHQGVDVADDDFKSRSSPLDQDLLEIGTQLAVQQCNVIKRLGVSTLTTHALSESGAHLRPMI
ncbi:MAG: hypothetical protein DI563_00040 [Variovorax paradoxus]|uniref:Uncharacterized protein n=1 Tax=Variovorax paradoxus TaxID=34073 RepID=A0A2W5QM90_VARPD|nr:MAG: hypothetical protein DI563_00040 [Variovorax paradoxus]